MKKPPSLTLRLFLCICALNIVTMLVVGLLSLRSANINISEEYDAQLITEASILWEILEEDSSNGTISAFKIEDFDAENTSPLLERPQRDSLLDYAQWRAFRVLHGGTIVMRSDNADIMPARPLPQGLSTITVGNDQWRVFSLHDPRNDIVVETYENLHNREILQRDILLDVLAPLMVMLPILGLLFSVGVGFALKGIHKLASQLATRSPSDLSRLESSDLPKELQPLAQSVNSLLAKVESSIIHEREFIDHAAHELRTPLSALKLQAQMLVKSIKAPQSDASLGELIASVDRTARLVDQMLLLSRIAQQTIIFEPVTLYTVATDTIGMYAVPIVDKDITLELRGDEKIAVQSQPELLRTLLGTLIDNAVKYTPQGGQIDVNISHTTTRAFITITDSGEGIPEAERARVFDRFYRAPTTKQAGSGLGLAIASQIAQLLHADITLETPENARGLRIIVAFPLNTAR